MCDVSYKQVQNVWDDMVFKSYVRAGDPPLGPAGQEGRLRVQHQPGPLLPSQLDHIQSLDGLEAEYEYSMVGHSGSGPEAERLIGWGEPPQGAAKRLKLLQRMEAAAAAGGAAGGGAAGRRRRRHGASAEEKKALQDDDDDDDDEEEEEAAPQKSKRGGRRSGARRGAQ